ncbi:MBL fold metallo-hydrolase [Vibrio sp. HN007]|uniref:MBL fold metallo-hydrolase n=1 Tax=Vibrio iocasae TaxID=3098914 RepID=UPI0035D4387C
MNTKSLVRSIVLIGALVSGIANAGPSKEETKNNSVTIQHVRNATSKITYGETTFLVDPMLAKKGAYEPFGADKSKRNPLLDLTVSVEDIVKNIDAVVVTHTHLDHWDLVAQNVLPKEIPLFTQHEADAKLIQSQGFTNVHVLGMDTVFRGVSLHRTGGQHASIEDNAKPGVAATIGDVMGVVFEAPGYKTTYIAGDTVWHQEVEQAIKQFKQFKPEIIVLNTGAAKLPGFLSDSILMDKEDVLKAHNLNPAADIVAVHMDTLDHCTLSRESLRSYLIDQNIENQVLVPNDGVVMNF